MADSTGSPAVAPARKRPIGRKIWREGDDGLFTQNWYVVCEAAEVPAGRAITRPFLDGDVAIFRGENGVVSVTSAYCMHLGANIAHGGSVVGNNLRCPFHHWEYDQGGRCVKIAAGDHPPSAARLFKFPTVERWGLIFAFNGDEPLYPLPDFWSYDYGRRFDDSELHILMRKVSHWPGHPDRTAAPVDPWMIMTNTLDLQHLRVLHQIKFDDDPPPEMFRWEPHRVTYNLQAQHWGDVPVAFTFAIHGNNHFYQSTDYGGRWFGIMEVTALPRPGLTDAWFVVAVEKEVPSGPPNAVERKWADEMMEMELEFYRQDASVLQAAHFNVGMLTRSDRVLAKHLEYLQGQPRAHPSAEFIR